MGKFLPKTEREDKNHIDQSHQYREALITFIFSIPVNQYPNNIPNL